MATAAGVQFGRACSLQLFNNQEALDISSDLRIRFQISANDIETPNVAVIRVPFG